MINPVKNIGTLLFVAICVLVFVFLYNVFTNIYTSIDDTLVNISDSYNSSEIRTANNTMFSDTKNVFFDTTKFLLFAFTGLTLFSSFTQKNSLTSYLFSFFLSVIACVVVYYLFANLYNAFIAGAAVYLTDLPTFFFDNFELLLVANVAAGIMSFVFVHRGGR